MPDKSVKSDDRKPIVAFKQDNRVCKIIAEIRRDSEFLVVHEFPLKALKITDLLKTELFSQKWAERIKEASDIRKQSKLSNQSQEVISYNAPLKEVVEVVRPFVMHMMESCSTLKLWINTFIPKIEETQDLSVLVQLTIRDEVNNVQSSMFKCIDALYIYHFDRAKVIARILRNPTIDDYICALIELDKIQFNGYREMMLTLQTYYIQLHDHITKNLDNIKRKNRSQQRNGYHR
ncbi:hypothetical protein ACOME3_008791 [Neoechinorhynchus agilis]